eukprot:m.186083 g.186083  ORF g.186083 m.186083 type:complete len:672 (-) comp15586_c0_seq10:1068-3083(-)
MAAHCPRPSVVEVILALGGFSILGYIAIIPSPNKDPFSEREVDFSEGANLVEGRKTRKELCDRTATTLNSVLPKVTVSEKACSKSHPNLRHYPQAVLPVTADLSPSCKQIRSPGKAAYVIAYDMFEDDDQLANRNFQFTRLFGSIQATRTSADLLLVVPTLARVGLVSKGLDKYNVKVVTVPWPLLATDLQKTHRQYLKRNKNCCGWREFYKLAVWNLTNYERVLLLDSDLQVVENLDHLLLCNRPEFEATPGIFSPLNGGFFALTPSLCTLEDMVNIVKAGVYSNCYHWGELGIQRRHTGAEGPQGFLYYYYFILPSIREFSVNRGKGRYLDKCIYNANLQYCYTNQDKHKVLNNKINVIHKPTADFPETAKQKLRNLTFESRHDLSNSFRKGGQMAQIRLRVLGGQDISSTLLSETLECTYGSYEEKTLLYERSSINSFLNSNSFFLENALTNDRAMLASAGVSVLGFVLRDPAEYIMDAITRRSPELVGASGDLASLISSGMATLSSYINAPASERVCNPLVASLAGVPIGRAPTIDDLRIAKTRMFGLPLLLGFSSFIEETMRLWHASLQIPGKKFYACSQSNEKLQEFLQGFTRNISDTDYKALLDLNWLDAAIYEAGIDIFEREYYNQFGLVPRLRNKMKTKRKPALQCSTVSCSISCKAKCLFE